MGTAFASLPCAGLERVRPLYRGVGKAPGGAHGSWFGLGEGSIWHGNVKTLLAHWKAAFVTGLVVVLPAAVAIGVAIWLLETIANFTNGLLLFVPKAWTHAQDGEGPMLFYWSVIALAVAILLVGLVGGFARYYVGKKLIQAVDAVLMRVPLLNKIYSALKQINDAFTSKRTASFKQVVLVEFPRPGLYSVGFVTGAQNREAEARTREALLSVFVPTPPLTGGSIVLVAEADLVKLDMSVADGLKFIMSLGSVSPAYPSPAEIPSARGTGSNGSGAPWNGEATAPREPEDITRWEGDGGPGLPEPATALLAVPLKARTCGATRVTNQIREHNEMTP